VRSETRFIDSDVRRKFVVLAAPRSKIESRLVILSCLVFCLTCSSTEPLNSTFLNPVEPFVLENPGLYPSSRQRETVKCSQTYLLLGRNIVIDKFGMPNSPDDVLRRSVNCHLPPQTLIVLALPQTGSIAPRLGQCARWQRPHTFAQSRTPENAVPISLPLPPSCRNRGRGQE